MKEKLVLIGNGMAGIRTIEELLKLAPELYDITVFGAEPHGNYNRILLSPVLAGEKSVDDIMLNDEAWYAENGITLHKGKTVTEINRARRVVTATDKDGHVTEAPYDRLLMATGSDPVILPVPGHDLPGVVTFRDMADVERMIEATKKHAHGVVIGGGLLGLEAANGLMKQGMHVTVVHLEETLMERQIDAEAGAMLKQNLKAKGLNFMMATHTEAILGTDRVTGVELADGTEIAADLVVMAVGIRPNTALAEKAGIYCERGMVVDDTMLTYDPRIYGVGECVQHRGQAYGLVAPLFEQGKVCANHLARKATSRYEGSMTSTKLKVTGVDLFSAGDFLGDEESDEILFRDPGHDSYKKVVIKDGRITGTVLYGDTVDGAWYFQLMRDGVDVSDIRDRLMFGKAHLGDSGHG
ncbi:MAG: FAD-dependent oxidoreductase, partial [Alphaproteobacteria bacterium]|nr:FAD-dependent oxidoreductase [Alphaproteobacteria bacterium]